MMLTGPQRNCLLSIYRAHPAVYEVRGAARLARRLAEAGLVLQLARTPTTRRFRLTATGLLRATRIAERREANHEVVRVAPTAIATPTAFQRPAGMPSEWPFPVSSHAWRQ